MIKLPRTEFIVMKYIWQRYEVDEKVPYRDIANKIGEENHWTKGTVAKLFSRLVKKGFLYEEKEGRNTIFHILINKDDYIEFETKDFLDRMYDNSFNSLFTCLNKLKKYDVKDQEKEDKYIKNLIDNFDDEE